MRQILGQWQASGTPTIVLGTWKGRRDVQVTAEILLAASPMPGVSERRHGQTCAGADGPRWREATATGSLRPWWPPSVAECRPKLRATFRSAKCGFPPPSTTLSRALTAVLAALRSAQIGTLITGTSQGGTTEISSLRKPYPGWPHTLPGIYGTCQRL